MVESSSKNRPIRIQTLRSNPDEFKGKMHSVQGWVKTIRKQKTFAFLELNDGSSLGNLQVIMQDDLSNYNDILETVLTGAALKIHGEVVESPGKNQSVEIKASEVILIGSCDASYPLQKKRHSFEFLRSIGHLRARTNTMGAVARIRSALSFATHDFFHKNHFYNIHTPIITGSDCEGAGELFRVTTLKGEDLEKKPDQDFFGKPSFLTVSGQLNAEAYASALSRVYTFGPTFRAENSNTSRHLAEFWMIEPEIAFADLSDNIELASSYIKSIIDHILNNCSEDLTLFDKFIEKGLIDRLTNLVEKPFEIISYTEAIQILENSNVSFEFPVSWGLDLQSEHERYLAENHFKGPLVVTDYPKEIKAFYMRQNDDGKTVAAMDILVPKIGEIVGGSQREERLSVLEKKMEDLQIPKEEMDWYLDLRRFGSVPHAGFGLGFERLVQLATGMENIRDVIPFPRYPGRADY